ncbi:unnamed protein product [Rotaria magnacalcarata]|uniref:Uncharacterized protein n=1 Tax=Rotaria magnacalcarata TaxID=392030 RepID=A0A816U4Q2_9BILA|nr:unnamed protein product [Rotaria magnacalcarata]CAF3827081.1 unnamed protein product [Rotaria magnacalcarata]
MDSQENTSKENSENNFEFSSVFNKINEINYEINNMSINDFNFIKTLEKWRLESHETIDELCKHVLNEYMNRTKQDIDYLHNLTNLIIDNFNKKNNFNDSIQKIIKIIEENLNQLKNIPCEFDSLMIDKSTYCLPTQIDHIQFDLLKQSNEINSDLFSSSKSSKICLSSCFHSIEPHSYRLCLSPQNSFYPYMQTPKSIINLISDYWFTLATNDKYLLTIDKSNLYLFDQSLKIVHQKSFLKQQIKDICWSTTPEKFIFISSTDIFTFDDKTMTFTLFNIYFNNNHPWQHGTCSETSLFLSTFGENPFIVELQFYPSIHFHKRYQSEIVCEQNDAINDIKYSDNNLAIIIENGLINQSYLQLYATKSFQCISIVSLGQGWGHRTYSFNHRYWIVIDKYNNQIIYILNNGNRVKTENYLTKPLNIVSWTKYHVVIKTMQTLNIHQCE